MSILTCLENEFADEIINKCEENKCKLMLNEFENKIILKGEKLFNNIKICDCLIFISHNDQILIPLVELKSKNINSSSIIEKFNNSITEAENIITKCNINNNSCKYYIILLVKSWRSSSEFRTITSQKIKFKGIHYNIIPKKCGSSFSDIPK